MNRLIYTILIVCFVTTNIYSQSRIDSLISKNLYKTILKETNIPKVLLDFVLENSFMKIIEIQFFDIETKGNKFKGIELTYEENVFGLNGVLQTFIHTNEIKDVQIYMSKWPGFSCQAPNESSFNKIIIQNSIPFDLLIEREAFKVPKESIEKFLFYCKKWNKEFGLKLTLAESNIFSFDIINTEKIKDFEVLFKEIMLVNPELFDVEESAKEFQKEMYIDQLKSGFISFRWYCYYVVGDKIYKNN
jgi:hypothetical protein